MISRTNKEVSDAFSTFKRHTSFPLSKHTDAFWRFCGVSDTNILRKYASYPDIWIFPPDIAHRIDLLNSPHIYAIFKAMEANGQLGNEAKVAP